MKAIIFSDWHIHNYKSHSKNVNRLENCLNVLEDLGSFCDKHDIEIILFAGDTFDTHKALLTEVINATAEAFTKFFTERPQVKFYAITGNHDQNQKNLLDKPTISAIKHLATFFPDNYFILDNDVAEVAEGVYVAGIPYYEYAEHFQTKLMEITDKVRALEGMKYLLIHQTPAGIGNELIPTECTPEDALFEEYDRVFCGHIHKRQDLTDTFHIVGSPIHRDMSDVGEQKGFYVMNLYNAKKKFVYLQNYPEFSVKYEDEVGEEDYTREDTFLVVKPRFETAQAISDVNVEDFSTNLEASQLVQNYWKEVDGKDEELLNIGLTFI